MTRLGVLGGTFDPPHLGHVVVAVDVRSMLELDELLLVPAGDPWQKRGRVVASAEDRLRMTEAAVASIPGISVSRVEVDRDGPSVTADTLDALTAPARELFLVLGADAATNMPTWRRLDDTRHLATVAVVERDGEHADPPGPGWSWTHVRVPRLEISSSDIRTRIGEGRPVDGLVPAATLAYIREHDLYTARR